ncbi:MAG: SUMF1/EgtB/PvdO family nonheme iron enzyme [Chloroflexota bacterium]
MRAYPWGNKFEPTKANTGESGIDQTTSVTQYSQGASPYGVIDMSGNVWEWSLTDWLTGAHEVNRTDVSWLLRGGSWSSDQNNARAASRYGSVRPLNRASSIGFRLVCLPPFR